MEPQLCITYIISNHPRSLEPLWRWNQLIKLSSSVKWPLKNALQRAKLAYYEEDISDRKCVLRAAPLLELTQNHHRSFL